LAKKVEGDSELTQTGALLGTPAYMAPEQTTGRRGAVTTATDVYGLGAVLYSLLAGKAPFGGESGVGKLEAVRPRAPRPPFAVHPRVPAGPGGDLPEWPGEGREPAVPFGRGAGRGPAALARWPADRGPAGGPGRAGLDVVPQEQRDRRPGRPAARLTGSRDGL